MNVRHMLHNVIRYILVYTVHTPVYTMDILYIRRECTSYVVYNVIHYILLSVCTYIYTMCMYYTHVSIYNVYTIFPPQMHVIVVYNIWRLFIRVISYTSHVWTSHVTRINKSHVTHMDSTIQWGISSHSPTTPLRKTKGGGELWVDWLLLKWSYACFSCTGLFCRCVCGTSVSERERERDKEKQRTYMHACT